MSSSRRHGPRPPTRLMHSAAPHPPPSIVAPSLPPTLLQPHRPVRNPWVAASDSSASSCASPPRATASLPGSSSIRRPASSLASSSRPPSRAAITAVPGCCSPGTQLLCYYCLRAALLATLLGGGALAVAGVVLREHGREDLGVLLYIGLLAALVSATLLAVQNRARHRATRRHFQRRAPVVSRAVEDAIPLQQFNAPATIVVQIPAQQQPAAWPQHVVPRSEGEMINEQRRSVVIQPTASPADDNASVHWWRIFGRNVTATSQHQVPN